MDLARWREELAWAAGFFDGEGTTRLNGKYGCMSANQVDRRALDRFRTAVMNVGRVNGPYASQEQTRQPIHSWQCQTFQDVQAVLAMLWPFLGEVKKEQARPVLEKMNFAPPKWHAPYEGFCRRGHPQAKYRTKAGQCRKCMRLSDARRHGYLTEEYLARWASNE